MKHPLPYPQCKLCLSTVTTYPDTTANGRHGHVNTTVTRTPVMSAFARRGGAGDRLLIPTLDEWAAWKAALA